MRRHTLRIPVLGAALLLAAGARADEPADPLPKGAKLRLGNARLAFRFAPAFAPVPPDYATIALADARDKLRRLDLATGRFVGPDKDDKTPVGVAGGQLVVSTDGKRYVVHRTGVVTVRDVATGTPVKELKRADGFSTTFAYGQPSVALSADGKVLAQGGQDKDRRGDVAVWDVDKGEVVFQTATAQAAPAVPILSADGKLLATWSYGGFSPNPGKDPEDNPNRLIQVWDVAGKKELFRARLSTVGAYQSAAAFSPDAGLLAASVGDGVIDWWDVKTGKPRPSLLGRGGQGQRLAFSPDGKTLAAVAGDGTVQRWAAADGKPLGTTEAPDAGLLLQQLGLAFAGGERLVAWGVAGSAPVAWEVPSGKLLTPPREHVTPVTSVAFAAGGKELVTSSTDGRAVRWDAATGEPLGPVALRPPRLANYPARQALTLSPDGARGVGAVGGVFDLKTGAEEFFLPRAPAAGGYNAATVVSRDVTRAVVTLVPYDPKRKGRAVAWDLTTRQKVGEVELEGLALTGAPPAAAISPSGDRLVTATFGPFQPGGGGPPLVVTGWDLKAGKKLGQFEDLDARGPVTVAAAGEAYAVVSGSNGRVRAYDYESGRGGEILDAGQNRFEAGAGPVVFSPDGKLFAVAGGSDEPGAFGVRVRDWPTGAVQYTFMGHAAPVSAVTFSPDGKTLATGSQDTTVLVWELKDQK